MNYLSGEAIVGFFVAVGGAAIVLQRVGIIKLPTTRNSKQDNPGSDSKEIDDVKKRVDRLTDVVMFKNTCDKIHKGVDDKFDIIHGLMKETRDGVKELLNK